MDNLKLGGELEFMALGKRNRHAYLQADSAARASSFIVVLILIRPRAIGTLAFSAMARKRMGRTIFSMTVRTSN